MKKPAKLTPLETLERSMPPELRRTPNGKQARPKPPPVPGSARKTRAVAAAEAEKEKEREKEKEAAAARKSSRTLPSAVDGNGLDTSNLISNPRREREKSKNGKKDKGGQSREDKERASREAEERARQDDKEPDTTQKREPTRAQSRQSVPEPASEEETGDPAERLASSTPNRPPLQLPPPPAFDIDIDRDRHAAAAAASARPSCGTTAVSSTQPIAAAAFGSGPMDPKAAALAMSHIALPSFSLFEADVSFAMYDVRDAVAEAVKATVREMPVKELRVFELL